MRLEDEIDIIGQSKDRMSHEDKVMFYELKKKSMVVGMLLAIFVFGGMGQVYTGKVAKGVLFMLISWLLIPYIYAIWDTHRLINEYNDELYLAVFGGFD